MSEADKQELEIYRAFARLASSCSMDMSSLREDERDFMLAVFEYQQFLADLDEKLKDMKLRINRINKERVVIHKY